MEVKYLMNHSFIVYNYCTRMKYVYIFHQNSVCRYIQLLTMNAFGNSNNCPINCYGIRTEKSIITHIVMYDVGLCMNIPHG